ncbi:uncharacterized protein L969DRAFT_42747 [Mixia osmundae IAM 14324]|uniref:Uncharacterized protein n=1 Tax=Mixia osmundae (strain CBS 9802 / IAM 14324 / JCM 22182 / KY 12970) TaxID=764103 RepID=G7DT15_MIXOS|nr:uncharacterized protein L969DRAFT_42747 [Mixia osmundae IAM 14324]KEI42772.1 hypothetical protein L969DRAFT_42747 [Mixia osmundae IAM 14324]GAA93894.1 hypothetical protein E5Q_00540 [Mixia osmundae IAM 14324]
MSPSADTRDGRRSTRHRSRSPDSGRTSARTLPSEYGQKDIDPSDDFFLRAGEFKIWLAEEKGRYLDTMQGDMARAYFKRFAKAWNAGKLAPAYYTGEIVKTASVASTSSHTWEFKGSSAFELAQARQARKEVSGPNERASPPARVALGPARPPAQGRATLSNVQDERERQRELDERERQAQRAQRHRERRDEREDERADRATGKDRLQEKRAEKRASNRDFAAAREHDLAEIPDSVLMGDDASSFKAALAARERSQQHGQSRKQAYQQERAAIISEKAAAYKAKEDSTMAMFKNLAQARFG